MGEDLGFGYAMLISALYSAKYPEKNVKFLNRGISGDRVIDLEKRWKKDCLDLKPDWVSILVGINDTWRRYDNNDPTSAEDYESRFRNLLNQLKAETKIILCEPFVLHVSEDRIRYREDLNPKIGIVRKLAKEYKAILVSFDTIFTKVSQSRPPSFWAQDGVHPTMDGHALMALSWLEALSIKL